MKESCHTQVSSRDTHTHMHTYTHTRNTHMIELSHIYEGVMSHTGVEQTHTHTHAHIHTHT